MTVDMLAAAFIWPEEMLIGRIGDDLKPVGSVETPTRPVEAPADPDAKPFWAALVHRFRAQPPAPRPVAR